MRPSHRPSSATGGGGGGNCVVSSTREKPCKFLLSGDCRCRYLHAGSINNGFSLLTPLRGHQKAVTGIALPSGTDMLFSSSKDGTVRVWDYQTGQDGEILAWRYCAEKNSFELAASLVGHQGPVVSLAVGTMMLYSGSMDHTIRVINPCLGLGNIAMDPESQTLSAHKGVVMSLLCWDQFLLSCSRDKTIKVWAAMETGSPAVTYTHNEDHGALVLAGIQDAQLNPILLCSMNDNTIHLYEFPSFANRGKISFEAEVGAVKNGPGGLIFTGDEIGELKVWKWN